MGYICLYTGTGAGKTTNALGLALHSIGHKRRVVIIQFLKWRKDIGEYRIKDELRHYYEIYQFGRRVRLGEKDGERADFVSIIVDVKAPKKYELAKGIRCWFSIEPKSVSRGFCIFLKRPSLIFAGTC